MIKSLFDEALRVFVNIMSRHWIFISSSSLLSIVKAKYRNKFHIHTYFFYNILLNGLKVYKIIWKYHIHLHIFHSLFSIKSRLSLILAWIYLFDGGICIHVAIQDKRRMFLHGLHNNSMDGELFSRWNKTGRRFALNWISFMGNGGRHEAGFVCVCVYIYKLIYYCCQYV